MVEKNKKTHRHRKLIQHKIANIISVVAKYLIRLSIDVRYYGQNENELKEE